MIWLPENIAAAKLDRKPRTLRTQVKQGKLKIGYSVINGRKYQYRESDIDKLLRENSNLVKN